MGVLERRIVAEHRNVGLIDITPDGHIEGASRGKHSDGIDFGHRRAAEMTALA